MSVDVDEEDRRTHATAAVPAPSSADGERRKLSWSTQLEDVLAKMGEECRGYAWIHHKSEQRYSYFDNWISIPVIVLSTVTGFLSASTGSIIPMTPETSIALGSVSVFVGILNTLGTKFGWAKRAEGHRVAYLSYSELFNFIDVEMKLSRNERIGAEDFIKMIRETMKRLAATSPSMPQKIMERFKNEFDEIKDISKPAETNGLSKITIYAPPDEDQPEEKAEEPKRVRVTLIDAASALPLGIKRPPFRAGGVARTI